MRSELDRARDLYWEEPAASLATAIDANEAARQAGDASLCTRALALQGAIGLHRGDLRGAFDLATEAEPHAERSDAAARSEFAALKSHLAFFSGSHAEALHQAEQAIALADEAGDLDLRVFARRAGCIAFGNVGVPDLEERLADTLRMTIESGNRWQEAISRNDVACQLQERGALVAAEEEIERGLAVARSLPSHNRFTLGVLHSTRADIRLLAGRAEEALADAEEAIARLLATGEPNPYVFGVTVRAEVQALMALGRIGDAQRSGEGALARLGDRVPQARSLILATLAAALREAGRLEEAFDALSRSADLERQAARELSELQRRLERATLEAAAARREAEQLREQADRDWLTGLHNRRYLARELERLAAERDAAPLSLAVLDVDHFKTINDRFGHDVGDRVLMRVADVLLRVLRGADVVVRSGGEEFVVLMPATDAPAAAAACERVRVALRDEPWERIAAGLALTASLGVASAPGGADLAELATLADRRLYDAKRAGRDRVVGERCYSQRARLNEA